jgi:hypothetical protein
MPPPRANRRQLWPRCMTPEVSCGGGWNEVWLELEIFRQFRWTLMELHGTAWSSLDLWSWMSFASISSDLSQLIPCPITCKPLSDLYRASMKSFLPFIPGLLLQRTPSILQWQY